MVANNQPGGFPCPACGGYHATPSPAQQREQAERAEQVQRQALWYDTVSYLVRNGVSPGKAVKGADRLLAEWDARKATAEKPTFGKA